MFSQLSKIPPIVWLVVGFVFFLSPHVYRYAVHHPDERHYTDAAMHMVESGDYLTPRTAAGDLRLKKPIVAYWMVATSYQLFGVSPFTSRLPFVLMGAGIVWLTYRLAWYLFENRETGLIAALVVSLQPALIVSSMRSLPDLPLTFFLLVSAFGFVRLLREPEATGQALTMAFGGAGMAIASKGLPAVVFAGFAIFILLVVHITPIRREWFRYASGFVLTVLLGGGWFFAMAFLHGAELLAEFTRDQVTDRLRLQVSGVALDFVKVLLILVVGLLPWWGWLREAMVAAWRQHGALNFLRNPMWLLITGWVALYLCLAAMVDRVNFRYLTPIVPLVAVIAAGMMAELSPDRRKIWSQRLGWSGCGAVAGLSLMATGICFELVEQPLMGVLFAIVTGSGVLACIVTLTRQRAWQPISVCATLSILAVAGLSYVIIVGASGQTLGERLRAQLESRGVSERSVAFATKPSHPARLRVESGGKIQPVWLGSNLTKCVGSEVAADDPEILVISDEDADKIDPSRFEMISIKDGFQKIDAGELCRAALAGRLCKYFNSKRGQIWLAIKRDPVVMSVPLPERIAENLGDSTLPR